MADRLQADGWTLLARNWRGGGGEIDVVVSRVGRVRFVEVKARGPLDPGGAEAVDESKQRLLNQAASAWILENPAGWDEVAFLVAVVDVATWDVEWFDDAFDGP